MSSELSEWVFRAQKAQVAANKVLAEGGHGAARVEFLKDVSKKLESAPIDVREYFKEAIVCLQNELTRSAVVLSWSGFFSLFCERLYDEKKVEIVSERRKWKIDNLDDLKTYPESQIIEVANVPSVGFIRNAKRRMLDGWLAQRNQCAHPTVYRPTINVAIGFVDSMVDEVLLIL